MPSNEFMYVRPVDGYAFNKYELNDLFKVEVNVMESIIHADAPLTKRWEFFFKLQAWEKNPFRDADKAISDLLTRALLAEYENPPIGPLTFIDDGGHNDR